MHEADRLAEPRRERTTRLDRIALPAQDQNVLGISLDRCKRPEQRCNPRPMPPPHRHGPRDQLEARDSCEPAVFLGGGLGVVVNPRGARHAVDEPRDLGGVPVREDYRGV
jgi:hypothetical protein